jgi:hypothetical protein
LGAAIALLVTALLGIAGYVVQNKASITANATQHELTQEASERQRVEDRAGKLLQRVQQQNEDFIYPVNFLTLTFSRAYDQAVLACGCESYMAAYAYKWVSPPRQPSVSLLDLSHGETIKNAVNIPFMYILPPDDLARLAADPAIRAHWEELSLHTMIPLLRKLVPILQTKVCTANLGHGPRKG